MDIIHLPVKLIHSFLHLFFSSKFLSHRLIGFIYLIQFFLSCYLYATNYNQFSNSILWWSLPLTGLIQSISASMTFTFLPKKQLDPGYYSDKSTLSYKFIFENSFYATILTFQWIYMNEDVYKYLLSYPIFGGAFEVLFVFLPYALIREPFFPKTHFRDSVNIDKNKTEKNKIFYSFGTSITAIFYLFAKHCIGFALNYFRYINILPASVIPNLHFMLLASCAATTISMFLHTLKFKGYISGRVSFSLYVISYLFTVYSWVGLYPIFYHNFPILVIALVGLVINRYNNPLFHVYQVMVAVLFVAHRYEYTNVLEKLLSFHF